MAVRIPFGKRTLYFSIWRLLILGLIVVGAVFCTKHMLFSTEFSERREKSHEYMLESARKIMATAVSEIKFEAQETLAGGQNSRARLDSLNAHLQRLATAVENIAVADRSASLDNIFERYSMLVALSALIFAIFGIYSGIHFKDHLVQLKVDMREITIQQNKQVENFHKKIRQQSQSVKERLDEVIDQSMKMIWMVGNNLEILTNLGVVDPERASTLLDAIYKTGFRFELHSPNPKERLSALHNLYAQGDCEDLRELAKIVRTKDEDKDIRGLAWRAIQKILKRCPHPDGHPDLNISNDGLFDDD